MTSQTPHQPLRSRPDLRFIENLRNSSAARQRFE